MNSFAIGNRLIGPDSRVFIIAELSANHHKSIDEAIRIIEAAKAAGADAVKLQTYTPDTITIDCDNACFIVGNSKLWQGRKLHDLYSEAYTPWEWHPKLKQVARELELELFSTPFDNSAVDFLESMDVPAYKVASFELIDIPLISRIARTGKPIIMSTGMGSLAEIEEAVNTCRQAGNRDLALLKCTSAYPASAEDINLRTIPHLANTFAVPIGLSDHTLDIAVPVAAVAVGASIIEKHLTLSRDTPGPDSAFSLEPAEFKAMVDAVRTAEAAIGTVSYVRTDNEKENWSFRRSLFAIRRIQAGERLTGDNICSIRPGQGLHPRYLDQVIGKVAVTDIPRGTPLSWDLFR